MTNHRPQWMNAISARNLQHPMPESLETGWSAFHRDIETVSESRIFRKLYGKKVNYAHRYDGAMRSRLSQAFEAGGWARSFARLFCQEVFKSKFENHEDYKQCCDEFESVAHAATLAKDIGSTPFAKMGARLIAEVSGREFRKDAQSVHILVDPIFHDSLEVSAPTLAALITKRDENHSFYEDDKDSIDQIFSALGIEGIYHPISYIVDAAYRCARMYTDIQDYYHWSVAQKGQFGSYHDELFDALNAFSDKAITGNETLGDTFAKALKSGTAQEFIAQFKGIVHQQITDFAKVFASDSVAYSMDDFPQAFHNYMSECEFRNETTEAHILYASVPGRASVGQNLWTLSAVASKIVRMGDRHSAAHNMHVRAVFSDLWRFSVRQLQDHNSDLLKIMQWEDQGYMLYAMAEGKTELAIVDLFAAMTDHEADLFWESIQKPRTFRLVA